MTCATTNVPRGPLWWCATISCVALAVGCGANGAGAGEPTAKTTPEAAEEAGEATAGMDPRALLRQMSARLANAEALTFEANRHVDPGLIEGRDVPEEAAIRVFVKRPDKLYAVARTPTGTRHVYFDGQEVTVFEEEKGLYAKAQVSGTIDTMIQHLDERFGFVPPLADFVANDPYALMSEQVRQLRHVGTETVDGKSCERLEATGELATADLWLASDSSLPCRLVARFTRLEGEPETRVSFSSWNLDADLSDEMFSFEPPEGAVEIEMVPLSDLEEVNP